LRARLGENGSPEYALTWKNWDMPSGPPICALRASARRTSANGCSGWPTPAAQQFGGNLEIETARRVRLKQKHGNGNGAGLTLAIAAQLAGWATPTAVNHRSIRSNQTHNSRPLQEQVGQMLVGSPAETDSPAGLALNPAMSRWLMGYPAAWDTASPDWWAWHRWQTEIELGV
jgi:hypothetical protein